MPRPYHFKGSVQMLPYSPERRAAVANLQQVLEDGVDEFQCFYDNDVLHIEFDTSEASYSLPERLDDAMRTLQPCMADGAVFDTADGVEVYGPTPLARWSAMCVYQLHLAATAQQACETWLKNNPRPEGA